MATKESKEEKEEREKKEIERERRLLFGGGNPYAKPMNEEDEEMISKYRKKDPSSDKQDLQELKEKGDQQPSAVPNRMEQFSLNLGSKGMNLQEKLKAGGEKILNITVGVSNNPLSARGKAAAAQQRVDSPRPKTDANLEEHDIEQTIKENYPSPGKF